MAYNHGINVSNDDTGFAATGQKLKSPATFSTSTPHHLQIWLRVVIPMGLSNPGSSTSYPSSP